MTEIKKLEYYVGNEWRESETGQWMDCYDPSTGKVIARAPQCTASEVEAAVAAAQAAYPGWSNTPATSGCRCCSA